jgi:hypothetical protein
MRIPPYWQRAEYSGPGPDGRTLTFTGWGWSFESADAAQDDARKRAQRIFNHFTAGQEPGEYLYLDRPMREEIIERITQGGKEIAVLTRNRYGALVLNSASVLFADVDVPPAKPSPGGILKLFSKSAPSGDPYAERLQAITTWAAQNPGRSFRLYRTAAGFRLLFTDALYDARSESTDDLLASLGSDPMYRTLTKQQESFRARLTPKPWRADCPKPPNRYPWESSAEEQAYRAWERRYADCTRSYRTVELIQEFGSASGDAEIAQIVQLHDQYALQGGAKLA